MSASRSGCVTTSIDIAMPGSILNLSTVDITPDSKKGNTGGGGRMICNSGIDSKMCDANELSKLILSDVNENARYPSDNNLISGNSDFDKSNIDVRVIEIPSTDKTGQTNSSKRNCGKLTDSYGNPFTLPDYSIKDIRNAIPERCFRRNGLRGMGYIARDLTAIIIVFCLSYTFIRPEYIANKALRIGLWTAYSVVQGLFGTGIWVLAHECGHHAFSESRLFDDVVGWIFHSLLLVPYFSWQISHSKHHKATGNIEKDMVFVPYTAPPSKTITGAQSGRMVNPLLQKRVKRQLPSATVPPNDTQSSKFGKSDQVSGSRNKPSHHHDHSVAFYLQDTPLATAWSLFQQQLFGWPMYLLTNVTGHNFHSRQREGKGIGKRNGFFGGVNHFFPSSPLFERNQEYLILLSDLGLCLTVGLLYIIGQRFGWVNLLIWYGIPYLWVNHWLVAITFLQHTDPQLPHYTSNSWTFTRGAAATIDRDMGFIGRHIFHGIVETHVLHHYVSNIPFYNAIEATEAIKPVMGVHYRSDVKRGPVGFLHALWKCTRWCQWVEACESAQTEEEKGVLFFRNPNGLGIPPGNHF